MKINRLKELALELVQLKEKCMREGLYETGQALEPATQIIGWEIARHTEVAQIERRLAVNAKDKIDAAKDNFLTRMKGEGEKCYNPNAAQLHVFDNSRKTHDSFIDYIFNFNILGEMLKLNVIKDEGLPYDEIELFLADPEIEIQIMDYIHKHLKAH